MLSVMYAIVTTSEVETTRSKYPVLGYIFLMEINIILAPTVVLLMYSSSFNSFRLIAHRYVTLEVHATAP